MSMIPLREELFLWQRPRVDAVSLNPLSKLNVRADDSAQPVTFGCLYTNVAEVIHKIPHPNPLNHSRLIPNQIPSEVHTHWGWGGGEKQRPQSVRGCRKQQVNETTETMTPVHPRASPCRANHLLGHSFTLK